MKKLFALLLTAVMCFSLAACGEKTDPNADVLKAELEPIMTGYGITEFSVQFDLSKRYEIVCPEITSLSNPKKCSVLKDIIALGELTGLEEKTFRFSGNIYIDGTEEAGYYYYVNSAQAKLSNRSSAGLYHSNHHDKCLHNDK